MDHDEYADYDLSEYTFTSADLAALDAQAAAGGPAVPIELERATDGVKDSLKTVASAVLETTPDNGAHTGRAKPMVRARTWSEDKNTFDGGRSPFDMYRRWRMSLSVTDLVSPAWCEVQYDYGLRQGRSRKLVDRPASFTSAKGKVIKVEHHVAAMNDKTQKRGTSVHKKLEKEIRPVEVKVSTTSEEERWALRLVQMLACLDDLRDHGKCREMPVFGILHDEVILGVIDEVAYNSDSVPQPPIIPTLTNKRSSSSTHDTPTKKKPRRSRSPTQPAITAFLSPSALRRLRTPSPPPSTTRRLYISDTKTRRTNDLPPDEDALPARLQLMFYHALLSALLTPTFPFAAIWTRFGLDPNRPLSDAFLAQSGLIPEVGGTGADGDDVRVQYPCCLDELEDVWKAAVQASGVVEVAQDLTIVYRTQTRSPKETVTLSEALADMVACITPGVKGDEDVDMQRAISASLLDEAQRRATASSDDVPSASAQRPISEANPIVSAGELSTVVEEGQSQTETRAQVEVGVKSSTIVVGEVTTSEGVVLDTVPIPPVAGVPLPAAGANSGVSPPRESSIIGTKSFRMDAALLDAHLVSILQWWHGQRAPRGVDVELARRCRTCEYREDCEWRESKAAEAASEYRRKNGRSPSVQLM